MRRRRFLAIAAAFAAAPAAAAPYRWRGRALGAEAEIVIRGPRDMAEPALAEARALIAAAEALFSLHDPVSTLSRLNAEGALDAVPGAFRDLARIAGEVHRATGGLFDPTVQPLWRALAEGRDPAPARALIGWDRVRIGPEGIALAPHQQLTFNGIAQGFATDRVAEALRRRGATHTLIDIGEYRALGGPFRLGIADPACGALGHWTLSDGAVATSSPAALSLGAETHILDPRGGRPLWSTVTVEAATAARADAFSTAFTLAPLPRIARILQDTPALRRVLVAATDGTIRTLRRT